MEADFWAEKWRTGQIGFHQSAVHADLLQFGADWLGSGPQRVLVPLCGKSLDLAWLAQRPDTEVIGVEFTEEAVAAFFAERGLAVTRREAGPYEAWSSPALPRLTLLRGDIFALEALPAAWRLGEIGRVWDRAALVALDRPRRAAYVHLLRRALPEGASVLLNVFNHGPDLDQGPPHSVVDEELLALFSGCERTLLHSKEEAASPGMQARGVLVLQAQTWRITLRRDFLPRPPNLG